LIVDFCGSRSKNGFRICLISNDLDLAQTMDIPTLGVDGVTATMAETH